MVIHRLMGRPQWRSSQWPPWAVLISYFGCSANIGRPWRSSCSSSTRTAPAQPVFQTWTFVLSIHHIFIICLFFVFCILLFFLYFVFSCFFCIFFLFFSLIISSSTTCSSPCWFALTLEVDSQQLHVSRSWILKLDCSRPLTPLPWSGKSHRVFAHERDHHPA